MYVVKSMPYPVVLLGVPLRAEGVEWLVLLGAVGELEKAGKRAPVFSGVREDGILKVDTMWQDVVVLIHPAGDRNRKSWKEKPKDLLNCEVSLNGSPLVLFVHLTTVIASVLD